LDKNYKQLEHICLVRNSRLVQNYGSRKDSSCAIKRDSHYMHMPQFIQDELSAWYSWRIA
jgi:hypothetical protein